MKTILVMSGKGGVGKTTVSVNLANYLLEKNLKIGLLDADMTGPNVLKMLGRDEIKFSMDGDEIIPFKINDSFKVASVAGFIEEGKAVIWRGSLKHKALQQLSKSKEWDEQDYLIVDFPPGTSDEHISAAQILRNVVGAVIVSTPQNVAIQDLLRSINFCQHLKIPIIGLIENMSSELFGKETVRQVALQNKLNFLGTIPLRKLLVTTSEEGKRLQDFKDEELNNIFQEITSNLLKRIEEIENETREMSDEIAQKNISKNILVPVTENNRQAKISKHFGHSKYFAIYDPDNKEFTFFENRLQHDNINESAVSQAIKLFRPKKVFVVNMGAKAKEEFKLMNVEVEFVKEQNLEDLFE